MLSLFTARLISPLAPASDMMWGPDRLALLSANVTAVLLGVALLYLAHQGHYARRVPFWTGLRDLLIAGSFGITVNTVIEISLRPELPTATVLAWLLFPGAVFLMRRIVRGALSAAGLWDVRVVVVGGEAAARQAIDALLSEPALGYRVAGVVRPGVATMQRGPDMWRTIMQHHSGTMVILALDPSENLDGVAESLVRERVPFAVVPRMDGLPVHGFERSSFISHDSVLFTYRNNLAQPLSRAVKVAFDLVVAIAMLAVLSPVLLIIAVLVSLDGGPIFYRHTRIGAGGRPFGCLKFRSMVPDADVVLRRTLQDDPAAAAEWNNTHKLLNDPRITRLGRTLRTTSLDELPQLLNVVRLEMSLVGPRPIVTAEMQRYGDDIAYYFEARPGLTGLWQVSGRSDTGYAQRVRLDTWYVKNWTIWYDVAILARTIPAVLQRRGAA